MIRLIADIEHIYINNNTFWSGKSATADNSKHLLEYVRRSGDIVRDVRFTDNAVRGTFNDDKFTAKQDATAISELWIEGNHGIDNKTDLTNLQWTPAEGRQGTHDGSGVGMVGPAHYVGGQWLYESGVNVSANAEVPQETYPTGQTVYFTDSGDGSGDGTYIVDNSGTPQGPI